MAGRGRGSGLSLTHEQLQALGIGRGETSAPILVPPPLYPKIEAKPLPLPTDSATDYMLIIKDQILEYFNESPAYVRARTKNDDVERYSDKYKLLARDAKQSGTLECVWANFPAELRPQALRKTSTKKRRPEDSSEIIKKLQKLEKIEEMDDSVEKKENVDDEIKKEDESDNEEVEEEQEFEADDGTDYANNYFDNGDDYDDEDDNLDDDPVY